MSVNIRPMKKEDLRAVASLEKECFNRPWSEKLLKESFENPIYRFLVAEETETFKVVGYIGYYRVLEEGDICNVAVTESFRGRHIGYHLVQALMQDALSCQTEALILEVRAGNAPAIHVYEKAGFQPIGRRKNYYEDPKEDALLYGLSLVRNKSC